jgi:hypothetical protein
MKLKQEASAGGPTGNSAKKVRLLPTASVKPLKGFKLKNGLV